MGRDNPVGRAGRTGPSFPDRADRRDRIREAWWAHEAPPQYQARKVPWRVPKWVRILGRRDRASWIAEVTGHGDYGRYHRRFNHDPATWCNCLCGKEIRPGHARECVVVVKDYLRGGKAPPWGSKQFVPYVREYKRRIQTARLLLRENKEEVEDTESDCTGNQTRVLAPKQEKKGTMLSSPDGL